MKSILEEFAYGNISPELRFFESDSEYGRIMRKLTDSEEKLFSSMGEQERKTLSTFIDSQADICLLSCVDRFIYGYRLGVLMTTEVFAGKEDLVVGN